MNLCQENPTLVSSPGSGDCQKVLPRQPQPALTVEKADGLKRRASPPKLIGKRFGRLVVQSLNHRTRSPTGKSVVHWLCKCDCGGTKVSKTLHLTTGDTISCGCARREMYEAMKVTSYKHGHGGGPGKGASSTYNRWSQMVARCTNPDHAMWKHYGARGITVCAEWLEFPNFLNDMGEAPPKTHLDRIDNSGGYCPKNCRWATFKESARNKRSCRPITIGGEVKTATEWAERFGIKASTVRNRMARGFPLERLFTKPK